MMQCAVRIVPVQHPFGVLAESHLHLSALAEFFLLALLTILKLFSESISY